jgi:hypothetical protein
MAPQRDVNAVPRLANGDIRAQKKETAGSWPTVFFSVFRRMVTSQ